MATLLDLWYDTDGDQYGADQYGRDDAMQGYGRSDDGSYGVDALLANTYTVDDVDVYALLDGDANGYSGDTTYNADTGYSADQFSYGPMLRQTTSYSGGYTPQYTS